MTPKPLAPHGTTARAKGRPRNGVPGCKCPRCRRALRRYDGWRRLRNAEGRTLTVPAAPVADHLRALLDAGAGWNPLQKATGCSPSTLSALLNGRLNTVRRTTAERITALQPGDCLPDRQYVPAIGATRRVRALQAIGHTCRSIAADSSVDLSGIQAILNGERDKITLAVHGRIAATYRQLARVPGSNTRAMRRAAAEGWPSPLAWDSDTIDDPDAQPEGNLPERPLNRDQLAEHRRAEALHLARFGTAEREIAARLGMAHRYVHDLLRELRDAA